MRLYRLVLRAYPRAFRDEYGAEMEAIFRARRRDVSGAAVLRLWIEVVADTLHNAFLLHRDILSQDVRLAARSLLRARTFAITAVIVAALGIGATTAAFSVADHVLLRPLPFPESERLVQLWQDKSRSGPPRLEQSPANYVDWERLTSSFAGMAAYTTRSMSLLGAGAPERVDVALVTSDLFQVLQTPAALGRTLTSLDRPDAPPAIVLSHAFWRTRFASDPGALGRTVAIDDLPHTIVGVMPQGFEFPRRDIDVWKALHFPPDALADRTDTYLNVVARLRDDTSLEAARSEMRVVSAQLEREYPDDNRETGAVVLPLRDQVSWRARTLLLAMTGAAACMLLIACMNLASLLLGRALALQRELAIRTALGGAWPRLLRQLLTESALLAAVSGSLGVLIAVLITPFAAQLVPHTMPIAAAPAVDLRMLGIAALTTVLTGLLFGVAPALRAARTSDASALRADTRSGGSRRTTRLRSALVVAEVVGSVVLIVASGLLLRALWRVQQIDPGFDAANVLAVRTVLPWPKYERTDQRDAFYSRVLSDVRALPGVTGAAYTTSVPMVWRGGIWGVTTNLADLTPEARERWNPDPGELQPALLRQITPGFFGTMGIPLLRGRDIDERDTAEAMSVAVVSQSFVERHWPGQDPIGRQFFIAFRERTVVGVVGDVRVRGLERESEPQVYIPSRQVPDRGLIAYAPQELVVRAAVPVVSLTPAIRDIVSRVDPQQPVSDVRLATDIVAVDTAERAAQLRVLGGFAALACLLAGVGVHGLLAYAVSERQREIGVRIALGAAPARVVAMVLRQAMALSLWGVVAGSVAALAAGQLLASVLAGVSPTDRGVFGAAAAAVLLMALAGSLVPARRAARIDPVDAIRAS